MLESGPLTARPAFCNCLTRVSAGRPVKGATAEIGALAMAFMAMTGGGALFPATGAKEAIRIRAKATRMPRPVALETK